MNFKITCFLLLMMSCTLSLTAQEDEEVKNAKPEITEYDFKDVSKAELQQKYHPDDSLAPAAIIYEKGKVDFAYHEGWEYNLEVTKRIKIYNKDGYQYANIKIPYYYPDVNKRRENIINAKARTYNLKNGKVVDERVRNRDMVEVEKSETYKILKFTFPKLKPGSVIEYTYTLVSPHITRLNDWDFQHDIPTDQSVYEVNVPEVFGYAERAKGYHQIYKNEKTFRSSMKLSYTGSGLKTKSGHENLKFTNYVYYAKDVPKMKDEPFVNNQRNFITTISHEMSYVKNMNTNDIEYLSKTWQDVILNLYDNDNFGDELERTRYFEDDIDQLIAQSASDEEKLHAIFNHVRNHINWNGDTSKYCSDKLKNIYDDGTGNSADINLMLTAMLRYAGFNANPILVSTISHGVPSLYPARTHYNYVICGIELGDGKVIKLDASSRFTKLNQLPYRCLNWNGRLIRRNGTSQEVSLVPQKHSKITYNMNLSLHEDGSLSGKIRKQFTEQLAYIYRAKIARIDEQEYLSKMKNDLNVEISDYQKQSVDEIGKPIIESFSFTKPNGFDKINDKIYISPLAFLATDKNPFKQNRKERKFPINFTYPRSKRIMINLNLPKGYKVEYMPEKVALTLPQDKGFFRYNISQSANGNIQIVVQEQINQTLYASGFYSVLKQFYTKMVEKEADKVVLTKI